jgi:hypothetical protein
MKLKLKWESSHSYSILDNDFEDFIQHVCNEPLYNVNLDLGRTYKTGTFGLRTLLVTYASAVLAGSGRPGPCYSAPAAAAGAKGARVLRKLIAHGVIPIAKYTIVCTRCDTLEK